MGDAQTVTPELRLRAFDSIKNRVRSDGRKTSTADLCCWAEALAQWSVTGRPPEERKEGKLYCSFCAKSQDEVTKPIAGPADVSICNECVALCTDIIAGKPEALAATVQAEPDDAAAGQAELPAKGVL